MGNIECCGIRSGYSGDTRFIEIIEKCKQGNKKYTDKEFPPTKSSLITDWNEDHEEVKEAIDDNWASI